MPHCTLEFSKNINFLGNKKSLLLKINKCLARTNLFDLNLIKSRLIIHDNYCVGNGKTNKAFVSLNLSIFEGREQKVKNTISEKCIELLKDEFESEIKLDNLNITIQITEMNKESYRKIN